MTAVRGRPRLTFVPQFTAGRRGAHRERLQGRVGDQAQRGTASSASTTPSPNTTASTAPATTATTTGTASPPSRTCRAPGSTAAEPGGGGRERGHGMAAHRRRVPRRGRGDCELGGWRQDVAHPHQPLSRAGPRVQPTGASKAFVVGATKDCTMEFRSTGDAAATWAPSTGVGNA